MGRPRRTSVFLLLIAVLLIAVPAFASARQFPGTPGESPRINTPNDPDFDHCETDDEDGPPTCTYTFGEQYERFGFAPNGSHTTALYHNPLDPHVARMSQQNTLSGRNPLGQVPGVSADVAWKYSTGDPGVQIAILDTGIRWNNSSLRRQIALNRGELPLPKHADSSDCANYDCNGDGAFNVDDYASDPRVSISAGNDEADAMLDGSDLIATFSNGDDADGNGFVDDIAGWDFFDDDNNPYDASSYSSANNHGSGRASDAAEQGNEGAGGIGVCPTCQIVPMRVWDTFVVDTNNFAQAALYAADNNIEVVEGAVGGLFNSSFARAAFDYAYRHGVFFTIVSSDLNTADHNIPTTYDEAMMVQGTVADVQGLGQNPPDPFLTFFTSRGIPLTTNAPIQTWFRNSGTTQYGGHAHIVMPAVTGSAATGQASGAAGLVISYARQRGITLAPNEVKQILTMTAFDVTAADTVGLGTPDPASDGWDQHFGYGLPDLGLALERVNQSKVPPQAFISSPKWFTPYNVNHESSVNIDGRISARSASYHWSLEWAPGIEPSASEFQAAGDGTEFSPINGTLGTIDLNEVRSALDSRPGGGATVDPTAPSKGPGDKDPNEPAFTVRLVVTGPDGTRAEDRKTLFAYRDATETYKKNIGTGGEASQRLFDLNGDNKLDTVLADSSGALSVLNSDGSPLQSFNNGQPVQTQLYPNVHQGAAPFSSVSPPREVLRTPAIGDIDGDLEPEIVDTAGEHVYAWNADGSAVPGFPVRLDPSFSLPQDRTRNNHIKRGFTASPVLADLNGDGRLDIVAAALDAHVYVWDGNGNTMPGFPKLLRDPTVPGAEIITTPAVGDITGDGRPDIVTPTQEFDANPSAPQTPGAGGAGGFANILTNILANVLGGSGRVYALDRTGNVLPGWPTKPNGVVPDALPFVGPGVDHVLANVDSDPELEAIGSVATGDVTATNANGSNAAQYDSQPPGGETVDHSKVLNLFENPIAANLDGLPGPEIIKGGITLNGLVNLGVAVGQNLPYNHVVQAWNSQTGAELPDFPQAVEDYQLLSSPSVADVSDAPGNEIVVGTGLYYLRDISATGVEGTGWPKFTGGWIFSTPAIGDSDGDGNLDITALTREGFAYSWRTTQPACGTNDEWWTSRHDEWNTGAYGTDSRPPGTPTGARAVSSPSGTTLTWTAPGDDWLCGTGRRFRVISSPTPIRHPTDGTVVGDFDATASAGSQQSKFVTATGPFFAVLYQDDAGNWGHLATASLPYPRPGGASPMRVPLVPQFRECTSPTSSHIAPLDFPSCSSPSLQSSLLSISTQGRGQGFARFDVMVGNSSTTADEADVGISLTDSDVRTAAQSDYTGKVLLTIPLRITDGSNGPTANEPGTVEDTRFSVPVQCVATAPSSVGSNCNASTTADTLVPGYVREGARTVISAFSVAVLDAGPDGQVSPPGCPPTCGTGDEQPFQGQGVFAP
jgi:Subtilase family/FG-GAP-like repeat